MRSALLALASMLATTLHAQQPSWIAAIESNARFRQTAEKAFAEYEESLSTRCTDIHPDWSRATHVIYVQPTNDSQGKLASAAWSESVPGDACGQPRRFRTRVAIHDGTITTLRQLPGTSRVGAVLERDLRVAIAGAVTIHLYPLKPQGPLDVLDTDFISETPPASDRSWNEVWLISFGTGRMKVPIHLVPDATGTGTSFQINPKTITDLR